MEEITMNKKILSVSFATILLCSCVSVFIPTVEAYVHPPWTLQWQKDLSYLPEIVYNDHRLSDNSLVMPVLYDVTGDGIQDVFITKGYADDTGYEGSNTHNSGDVWCLNGATGAVIWHYGPKWNIGNHAVMCIHDLDADGDKELLVCGYHNTTAFHAENGQVLWNEMDGFDQTGHRHDKPAVVLKENGEIYVYTCMNAGQLNPGGIQKRLGATGEVVAMSPPGINHPCYGGLSAADINNDGQIEITIGDRSISMPGGGVGMSCYKASDLSLLWSYNTIACSTQTQEILDVDGDGGLDAIVNNQAAGTICAVDGATGQPITSIWNIGYWPWYGDIFMSAIYDIDKDGHLEDMNGAEGFTTPTPTYVYDLETGALDATLMRGDGLYGLPFPPIVANVYGDSDMELINEFGYEGIDVWDSTYTIVAIDPIYNNCRSISPCMTVIDMDNDGYNEIIQLCHKDGTGYGTYATVQIIHTTGLASNPKATAKDFGYTYKRSLVSQYVPYDDPDNLPGNWTLTVNIPDGHGNVTKYPDKNYYQTGDIVTLLAIADPQWVFDYWSGDLSGNVNPVNIVINSNMTVTAYFTDRDYPPYSPHSPYGPTSGKTGIVYNYTTNTIDPDDDQVYYKWNWGDGTISDWLGPFPSDEIATSQHTWNKKGWYQITVKAKDIHGLESNWSDPLSITMPQNSAFSFHLLFLKFLEQLFERFPNAFPILRNLSGYQESPFLLFYQLILTKKQPFLS
jgi:hypothetical protein